MSRKRKARRVVVVGSRSFPLDETIAVEIVDLLRTELPAGSVVLTRGSAGFDQFISTAAELCGYTVELHRGYGGASNFERDIAMVGASDTVMAFLDPDSLHSQNTGTAHVLESALTQHKRVMAYSAVNSKLVYAGANP